MESLPLQGFVLIVNAPIAVAIPELANEMGRTIQYGTPPASLVLCEVYSVYFTSYVVLRLRDQSHVGFLCSRHFYSHMVGQVRPSLLVFAEE